MRVVILLLALVITPLFPCALCYLSTPTAHIKIYPKSEFDEIKSFEIKWYFSSNFTNIMLGTYDENLNLKLDKNELDEISKAFLDYALPKDMLMSFEYYEGEGESEALVGEFKNFKAEYISDRLVFSFEKEINHAVNTKSVIKVVANDDEGFFNFTFLDDGAYRLFKDENSELYAVPNSNLNASFISFSDKFVAPIKKQSLDEILSSAKDEQSYIQKLKMFIKQNSESFEPKNLALIAIFSFIYGFFHAAGPGHAKILTAGYFMSNKFNYIKGLFFCLKIGFFHIFAAFLLVVISMFATGLIANALSQNVAALTTKISAIIIILIAIFVFIDKIHSLKHNHHHHSCSCASCQSTQRPSFFANKSEWFIVLASSLIPCPGTIIVFVLAFNLGSYAVAVMSAVFMTLGMSVVIFISAVFGSAIRVFKPLQSVRVYVEFAGIILMLTLGVGMFLISNEIGMM